MYKTRSFIYFIIYKYRLLVTKLLLRCRNLVNLQHSIESCERKYLWVCVYVCVCVCVCVCGRGVFVISNKKMNVQLQIGVAPRETGYMLFQACSGILF